MANDDSSGANHPDTPQTGFLSRYVFSTNHKAIGLNYLWLALFSVFLGMAMSLLMRVHLVWPGVHLPLLSSFGNSPDRYAALATLHGSLMVFLVLTAAPQAGFGNYFLPLQIGAREMAFPMLNFFSTQRAGVIANAVPTLWQRLFWFFAQAEVYVAMLPCFGLVTHLVATFSRKPVWKERLVVLALCGVGLFGFCVWGQHMFSSR